MLVLVCVSARPPAVPSLLSVYRTSGPPVANLRGSKGILRARYAIIDVEFVFY